MSKAVISESNQFGGVFEDSDDENESDVDIVDTEITLNYQEKYMPVVRNFNKFMNNMDFLTGKNDPTTNIVDMCSMHNNELCTKMYHIPDRKIPKMFKHIELCRRQGASMMVYEKQGEYSGIMLDFDIYQKEPGEQLTSGTINAICGYVMKLLYKYIKLDSPDRPYEDKHHSTYFAVLRKPCVKFMQELKAYKEGFHILIPTIQVKREVKKFFLQCLRQDLGFLALFRSIELADGYSYEDIIDLNSAHVPVFFIGSSSKRGSPVYVLDTIASSTILVKDLSDSSYLHNMTTVVIDDKKKLFEVDDVISKIVLCHEFSLNWENNIKNKSMVKKYKYTVHDQYLTDVEAFAGKSDNDGEDKDLEHGELSILNIHDSDVEYIKDLLDTLNPRRYIEFEPWFKVLCVLAHTSKSYKPLAEHFSKKCEDKYNPIDFEHHWQSASSDKQNKLNIGSLHYWAKLDNVVRYDEIRQRSVYSMVYKKVYDSQLEGSLQHYDIAQILYKSLRHKFAFDTSDGGNWYEFVLKEDRQKPGEVFKWRAYNRSPNSMKIYISEILPELFKKVFEKIDAKIAEQGGSQDSVKYHVMIKNNLKMTCRKLRDSAFKSGIMKEAEQVFERINFAESLDKDPDIMGVGNGILKLDDKVQFIAGYHSYLVSRHTPVEYKPFDPFNTITQKLLCALRNLFPDDEPDSFEFVMCYLSTALDAKKKESLIMLLIGTGSNGKTFLLELLRETLSVYGVKMSLSFLTYRSKNADAAQPALMALQKARAALYSEAERSETLLMSKVKEVTGQEAVSGRKNYGDEKNFKPVAIHVVASNYEFQIPGNDHGSWRRILLVPMRIKLCKKNVDEYDEKNPYERIADSAIGSKWTEDPEIQSAFLSILCHYYELLQTKYNGIVENVPHPHIIHDTEEYRDRQDKINNFINIRFVKTIDKDSTVSMTTIIEKYTKWHEGLYPDEKDYKKSIANQFENSKLSKIIRKSKTGVFVIGYRILDAGEEPEDGEKYFMDAFLSKKTSIADVISEPTDKFYERICKEYEMAQASEEEKLKHEIENLRKRRQEMLKNKPVMILPELAQSSRKSDIYTSKDNKPNDSNYDENGFKKAVKSSVNITDLVGIIDSDDSDESD